MPVVRHCMPPPIAPKRSSNGQPTKNPKYPDPLFNLAKQAAMVGDIPGARELLKQTHARGGKNCFSKWILTRCGRSSKTIQKSASCFVDPTKS